MIKQDKSAEKVFEMACLAYKNDRTGVLGRIDELTGALSVMSGDKTPEKDPAFFSGLYKALKAIEKEDLLLLGDALMCDILGRRENREGIWSSQFPYTEARRAACFFGNAEGYYLEEFVSRFTENSVIIAFDPCGKETILDLKEELTANLNYYLLEGMTVACEPGYDTAFRELYGSFMKEINMARERILVNKNTLARFKNHASRNVILNLPMLEKCNLVTDLKKILKPEIPVVIVSAGPSLDKNIEELRRAKGHCLIFAVDTAMKYLMERDIIPDLGITVEPIKPMANYGDERCFTVPHVFDCESNPEIVQKTTARKFIINCRDYVKNLFEAVGVTVPTDTAGGGSVATSAFAVCYQLGVRRIILIGQDLAYLGTSTHAGNVESAGINNTVEYEYVEGALGGQVRTRCDWLGYLKWFENSIAAMKEMGIDCEVIDATEGGALIHGTAVMPLYEAIDRYMSGVDYCFEHELEKLEPALNEKQYLMLRKLIKISFGQLLVIRESASKGLDSCRNGLKAGEAVRHTNPSQLEREYHHAYLEASTARRACEAALIFPLINNYAVCEIAEEAAKVLAQNPGHEGALLQMKLAFEAILRACDYFEKLGDTI